MPRPSDDGAFILLLILVGFTLLAIYLVVTSS